MPVYELPTHVSNVPTYVNVVPIQVNDVPTHVNDVPTYVNDVPINVNDVPTHVNNVPTCVSYVPTNVNDVPTVVIDNPLYVIVIPYADTCTADSVKFNSVDLCVGDKGNSITQATAQQPNTFAAFHLLYVIYLAAKQFVCSPALCGAFSNRILPTHK